MKIVVSWGMLILSKISCDYFGLPSFGLLSSQTTKLPRISGSFLLVII